MTQDRFKLITKVLHFTDNSTRDIHDHPNCSKFNPYWNYQRINFKSAHLLAENIAIDELLTLLTYRPHVPNPVGRGEPSTNPQPEILTGRHFIEKIPPTGKKLSPRDDVRFAPSRRTKHNLLVP
jgi:hypothetical protein